MKKSQILKKIIEKAIKNGYKNPMLLDKNWETVVGGLDKDYEVGVTIAYVRGILTSHNFARLFFGEERIVKGKWFIEYVWQYKLREAVIDDNLLEFYYKHL
jgi:hypothetical protein